MLGIPKDTLRYYDRIGVVSPLREDNRYRRYSKEDLIDLMNIQIMQYADFSLNEMKGTFSFHRMEKVDPDYCEEVAVFLDAKIAETLKKIAHLEKVVQLLNTAAGTLRNFNADSDRRLAEIVREIYKDIPNNGRELVKGGCDEIED